jgi:hypothetical protein
MNLPKLRNLTVSFFLLPLTEAGGDPGVFCYRMGAGILSNGHAGFLARVPRVAGRAPSVAGASRPGDKRTSLACCNLFSTFFTHFSTLKD